MNRGAANTLRVLGIIVASLFTLLACGLLLLLAMCARSMSSSQSSQVVPWFIGAIVAMVAGLWVIFRLARGIRHSSGQAAGIDPAGPTLPQPSLSEPLLVSGEGQKAIDLVVFALGASLVFSIISWLLNQSSFSSVPRSPASGNLLLVQIAIYVLYHAPYAILLYSFLTRPARWTFYYTVASSVALAAMTLFTVSTVSYVYLHNPRAFLLVLIAWAIDIAILVVAWRAMRQNGIKPDTPSLLVATLVALIYFIVVRSGTTFLYRFVWR